MEFRLEKYSISSLLFAAGVEISQKGHLLYQRVEHAPSGTFLQPDRLTLIDKFIFWNNFSNPLHIEKIADNRCGDCSNAFYGGCPPRLLP
jgi:hypothetical protein